MHTLICRSLKLMCFFNFNNPLLWNLTFVGSCFDIKKKQKKTLRFRLVQLALRIQMMCRSVGLGRI